MPFVMVGEHDILTVLGVIPPFKEFRAEKPTNPAAFLVITPDIETASNDYIHLNQPEGQWSSIQVRINQVASHGGI